MSREGVATIVLLGLVTVGDDLPQPIRGRKLASLANFRGRIGCGNLSPTVTNPNNTIVANLNPNWWWLIVGGHSMQQMISSRM